MEDIDPPTSIPTYIVNGKEKLTGINVFDTKVEIKSLSYIGKIAHGFGRIKLDGQEDLTDAVTLGHVLENMFFSTLSLYHQKSRGKTSGNIIMEWWVSRASFCMRKI